MNHLDRVPPDGAQTPAEFPIVSREAALGPRLAWHARPGAQVVDHWQGDATSGLTPAEAQQRLARVGPNSLADPPPVPQWRRLLAQFQDSTVLALLLAAVVAAGLGVFAPVPGQRLLERFGDPLAILTIVILNAALGLVQERRAERALHALRLMSAPLARVLRGGVVQPVPAADVVPGDVVLLEPGDHVPADLRLLEGSDLEVNESALTGESQPVSKNAAAELEVQTPLAERVTMAFMGTQVEKGRGRGVVTNTGMHTELGSIAGMLSRLEQEPTPLERELDRFGKQVVLLCVAISVVVFAAGVTFSQQSLRELFLVAVALAVAAIPEGLPAVTTIVLAIGTQRMAQRHALVRRLPAVETLGCTQVICTDKTGTLTQNRMAVRAVYVLSAAGGGARYDAAEGGALTGAGAALQAHRGLRHLLRAAAHVTGAHVQVEGEIIGNPTDSALLSLSLIHGAARAKVAEEQPFSSLRKMASVVVSDGARTLLYARGAPEVILQRCGRYTPETGEAPLPEERRAEILAETTRWAQHGMRVIALAWVDGPAATERDPELSLLGLVGIMDPPRPEVRGAVAEARAAGIQTMIITGDHPATAQAIAEQIDLWRPGDIVLSGEALDRMDQQELTGQVDRLRVVARATAEHKLRIVEALKRRGLVCAMTGDGVNDAPAVKAASIGVAMGRTGTDVTREAAALVLADDNYATIIAAVEEGRALYANIRKFIFFLLSSNTGCVLVVFVAALLGWPTPLLPAQILWINLITNGLPALALGLDGREADQMREPPRRMGGSVLSVAEYLHILLVGAVMAAAALWGYHDAMTTPGEQPLLRARTECYAVLALSPLLHAFNCRSRTQSLLKGGLRQLVANRPLLGALGVGVLLAAATFYIPVLRSVFKTVAPDGGELLRILGLSAIPTVFVELGKLYLRRRRA